MKWDIAKLGDHCDITSSKRIFYSDYVSNGVPFYRSKEIIQKHDHQEIDDPLYITKSKFDSIYDRFGVPQVGDMLLTSVGTIGIPYIVNADDYFYFKDGNLTWFRDFDNTLSSSFLYYWIQSHDGKGALNSLTIGSSQKALTIASLKGLNIPLPSIDIQNRIADILSAYDNLIANNHKQIKLLEEAAMRLYKEWFVNRRFPGYETTPIVDGVPEGWERSTVSEVASTLRRGISPQYNLKGKSIVINQKCIRQFLVSLEESRYQDKPFSEELRLVDGDVVICSTGTGTLGRVGQIFGDLGDCTFDSHVTLVRANNNIGKNYLGQALYFQQPYFESMGKGSTNQTELSKATISLLPILIPSERTLDDFERIVQILREKMLGCAFAIERLCLVRDKLIPKLMSGEIEV